MMINEELEWKTRKERVDKKLKSIDPSWTIIKHHSGLDTTSLHCHAVTEYPTANGPADYALFIKGKLLGIIEAKKVSVSPQNVLEQAKRYSKGAFDGPGNWHVYRVPFLYATNGEVLWHIDVRNEKNISRQIANFHTADTLEEFFEDDRANGLAWLANNPVDIEGIRPYQIEAINAIEDAIVKGKRSMLIAMATGTQSVFKFDVQGQVANSTHAGIPWLRNLRRTLGLSVHFWPFDGWIPRNGSHVMAEVYPSLWRHLYPIEGRTKDQQDAYATCRWLQEMDSNKDLTKFFDLSIASGEREIASIEGWILGVT